MCFWGRDREALGGCWEIPQKQMGTTPSRSLPNHTRLANFDQDPTLKHHGFLQSFPS
jgi:hypothetical protein